MSLYDMDWERDHAIGQYETEDKCPKWIPVGERLPEDAREVLTIMSDGEIDVYLLAFYMPSTKQWFDDDGGDCNPTHWMPLPEPPAAAIRAAGEREP